MTKTTDQDAQLQYLKRDQDFERQIAALTDGVDAIQDWDEEDLIACAQSFWANADLTAFIADELNGGRFDGLVDTLCEKIHQGFHEVAAKRGCLHTPDDAPSFFDLNLNSQSSYGAYTDEFFRLYLKVNALPYKVEYWLREIGDDGLPIRNYHVLPVKPDWAHDLMEFLFDCDHD